MRWICPECGYENEDYLIKCICGYEDIEEDKEEIKNVSLREKICNSFEVLVIKYHSGDIAIISIVGSFFWIFFWVNDRWSMLSNGITIAFILINITFFLLCFLLHIILSEKLYVKFYIIPILMAAEIALVTLQFSFGVVKSKPIVTMGKVLDKQVEDRTGTIGPGGGFIRTVHLIEIVSEEHEFTRFNFTVPPDGYNTISIGDPIKFTYHIESISIFGISKKRMMG